MKPLYLQICSTACIILYIAVDIAVGNWINVAILIPILCLSLFQLWWMLSGKKRQLRKRGLEAIELLSLPYPSCENVITTYENVFTVQLAIASGCLSPSETTQALAIIAEARTAMVLTEKYSAGEENDCRFYDKNPYLFCAVNPTGTCANCPHFEPINK